MSLVADVVKSQMMTVKWDENLFLEKHSKFVPEVISTNIITVGRIDDGFRLLAIMATTIVVHRDCIVINCNTLYIGTIR